MYFLSAIGIAMAGAICFYENNNISINRITINKELNEKIKIVQLSDLHSKEFGKENNKLLSKILKEEPDLILLTGDIIDCSSKKYMEIINFISKISMKVPTYYIPGNHETRAAKYEEIIMKLKKNNVNVLLDEIRTITIKGNKINILGLVEEQGSAEAYMKRAKGNFQYKDYSIIFQEFAKLPGIKLVLCHYPENFKAIGDKSYYKYKFDLMFSGHAHGGQFRLPFVGGLYAPGQGILPKYTAGVHSEASKKLIINRGLGNSGFPLRLFNRPEIVTVTIE
nr:metallophosphoesterase [uncultured Clostridium sp.]